MKKQTDNAYLDFISSITKKKCLHTIRSGPKIIIKVFSYDEKEHIEK